MNIGEQIILNIEKLGNQGIGIAKKDGFVVFVNNVCPGDVVKVKVEKIKKNYSQASLSEIISPSQYRTKPFCPMQKVCGSCQLQFIDYEYQLKLKQQIVKEAISSIGGICIDIPPVVPSPEVKNYRCKVQYPVSQTKNSKRIIAGYYKPKSHEIINIKYCPIQPVICDEIIEYIRNNAALFNVSGYDETKSAGLLRHVVIRHSDYSDKNLVVLIINSEKCPGSIKELANSIYNNFDSVSGVSVNYNLKKTNVIFGLKTESIVGGDFIEEKLADKIFYVGADTFFQVNPKSANNIFNYVKSYIKDNFKEPDVLDAYAGISTFGICVSEVASNVVSIEENLSSVELAKKSSQFNNVTNIEIHGGDAARFFAEENRKFDVVILDPPRKGCSESSLANALKLCKDTIIYVSCNPATLARDLRFLVSKGCKVESIQPFDMFCHTYHVENVAVIKVK